MSPRFAVWWSVRAGLLRLKSDYKAGNGTKKLAGVPMSSAGGGLRLSLDHFTNPTHDSGRLLKSMSNFGALTG